MATDEQPKVVVVIDDDELVRNALQGLMKAVGLRALGFASAEDFLNSGALQHVACLIADMHLPGISGLELQAKLNADHHEIPILFITAHGDEKMRLQALRGGAVEFLMKPIDDEVIVARVRAALKS